MKLATFIVTVLAAAVVTVEAHNVRVGEREHHKPREHRDHQKSRTGDASDDGPQTIIGGTQSTENEFPYYVDTSGCGGSLIAPKVVLTAAHCGEAYYEGKLVVVNGYQRGNQGTNGIIREVAQVVPHPEYNSNTNENDIELYLLTEAVTGLSVNLVLNQEPTYPSDGTDVTALGIGMQDQNGGLVSGQFLHDVVIPIVNFQQCSDWLLINAGYPHLNPDLMLCAGALGKGTCNGDSGGPLVVRNGNTHTQVGVVSFGAGECAKNSVYESVFARTSGATNWIKSVVCDTWNESADFCDGGGAAAPDVTNNNSPAVSSPANNNAAGPFGTTTSCNYDSQCPSNQYCNQEENLCQDKLQNGQGYCVEDTDCVSGFCNWEFRCQSKLQNGQICTEDDDCVSTYCNWNFQCQDKVQTGDVCTEDDDCVSGYCNWGFECQDKLENTLACVDDDECISGYCNWLFFCQDKSLNGELCAENDDCVSGYCNWDHKSCMDKLGNGETCSYDTDCVSGYCTWGWECMEKLETGEGCVEDDDCISGQCSWRFKCY